MESNILITGASAIRFEGEIMANKSETINHIIIIIITIIIMSVCELIYLKQHPTESKVYEKPVIIEEMVEEDFNPDTFLGLQTEIASLRSYYSSRYQFYEITLNNGCIQLKESYMREYINQLARDLYRQLHQDVLLSVVNELNTEQVIYSSLNGKEFYYIGQWL